MKSSINIPELESTILTAAALNRYGFSSSTIERSIGEDLQALFQKGIIHHNDIKTLQKQILERISQ